MKTDIGSASNASSVAVVRRLNGVHFLRREVSHALGVSVATLRRLSQREAALAAPLAIGWGSLEIAVYDEPAVERLHEYLAVHRSRAGRPRLWSADELRERRAAYSAVTYRRRRARDLDACGRIVDAQRAQEAADELAAELRRAHAQRTRTGGLTRGRHWTHEQQGQAGAVAAEAGGGGSAP